jgi:hypothetical protein
MDKIRDSFEKAFSDWNIKFPDANDNGFITDCGWLIQYCKYGNQCRI